MDGCEIIKFTIPTSSSILYASNFPDNTSIESITELFSNFGLVYDIIPFASQSKHDSEEINAQDNKNIKTSQNKSYYIIKYYSILSAKLAQKQLNGSSFQGRYLYVSFFKSKNQFKAEEYPLPIQKSIELANYYLGFNGWSSSIISLDRLIIDQREDIESKQTLNICSYKCVIKHFYKDGQCAFGVGESYEVGPDLIETMSIAKKMAITNARKDAFKHTIIILLESGKVGLHLLRNEKYYEIEQNIAGVRIKEEIANNNKVSLT